MGCTHSHVQGLPTWHVHGMYRVYIDKIFQPLKKAMTVSKVTRYSLYSAEATSFWQLTEDTRLSQEEHHLEVREAPPVHVCHWNNTFPPPPGTGSRGGA